MKHAFNAHLQYVDIRRGLLTYDLWVMEFTQDQELAGEQHQSKTYSHFYPKNFAPGDLVVTGRVPQQEDYNNLAEFIRGHHMTLMASAGLSNVANSTGAVLPLMTFSIPSEGTTVEGFIKSFAAGAKRFNVAPQFQFNFFVVKDRHSRTDMFPAETVRRSWDGSFVSLGNNNVIVSDSPNATQSAVIAPNPGIPGAVKPPVAPGTSFPGVINP